MNVQHERNSFLRARLQDRRVAAELELPWRTNSIVAQLFFFVLTCLSLGAFYGLLKMFEMPLTGVVAGGAAIVLAEILIARRWFFSGVEAALWIGGLFAIISELPSSGKPEAMLVLGAVCAVAGARVRNPLFGAAAAVFVMIYFEWRFDLGVICALILAFAACLALLRSWQRPTTEALWIALALILPIAGRFTADEQWRITTIALYLGFGAIALMLGIARRHHALLLAAIVSFTIAGIDIGRMDFAPPEARFAISGVLLLAISFALTRALRDRTSGFVLTPIQLTPFDDAGEIAATLALQPSTAAPPLAEPQPASGGGSFGGAGASGEF
jgi:hypothetical protein